jgi:hypothetical protein
MTSMGERRGVGLALILLALTVIISPSAMGMEVSSHQASIPAEPLIWETDISSYEQDLQVDTEMILRGELAPPHGFEPRGGGGCPEVKEGKSEAWEIVEREYGFYYNNSGCPAPIRRGTYNVSTDQGWGWTKAVEKGRWGSVGRRLTRKAIAGSFFVPKGTATVYYYDYRNQHGTARRRVVLVEYGKGVQGIITTYSRDR